MRLRLFRRVTPADLPPRSPAARIPAAPAAVPVAVRPDLPTRPRYAPPTGPRYLVTYDRVGDWGRGGTPAPAPLTVQAATREQIEAAIRADVRSYLPSGTDCRVIADLALMAGQLRAAGSLGVGTFSLQMLPGGEQQ